MINFENLKEVKAVNTRVQYDLRYSAKTGKFTLSGEAFNRFNISDNGFTIHTDGSNVVLAVRPAEESTILKGREGGEKGNIFSAKALIRMLDLTEDAEFKMNDVVHNGVTYITLERINEEEEEHNHLSIFTNQ